MVAGAAFAGVPWSAGEDEATRDDGTGVTVSVCSSAQITVTICSSVVDIKNLRTGYSCREHCDTLMSLFTAFVQCEIYKCEAVVLIAVLYHFLLFRSCHAASLSQHPLRCLCVSLPVARHCSGPLPFWQWQQYACLSSGLPLATPPVGPKRSCSSNIPI